MGKQRQLKALGKTQEQRVAARGLNPKGRFTNGSSAQKARDKVNRKKRSEPIPFIV